MAQPKFIAKDKDIVFAVVNSRVRHRDTDAILTRRLTAQELQTYYHMVDGGEKETKIFDTLFPQMAAPSEIEKITVDPSRLTKTQLSRLISQALVAELSSLRQMTKEDLVALLRAVWRLLDKSAHRNV
jgi:hypothetical protein